MLPGTQVFECTLILQILACFPRQPYITAAQAKLIGTFRFEYEIENEYEIIISIQSPPLILTFPYCVIPADQGIVETSDPPKHANKIGKVVLVLNLVHVLKSEVPY